MNRLPEYTITDLTLKYIIKYELSTQRVFETPLPYKYKSSLYQKNKSEEILALSQLINQEIGFDKAEKVQEGKLISTTSTLEYKIFNNFRSTQGFINAYNSNNFLPPSSELILHINKLLMNDLVELWELSKYRNFSDKPNELYDTWYKLRDHYPNIDNSEYFNSLMIWISSASTNIHKLIQFSILLYEFIDKAPLSAGNQITSLAVLTLLLKEYKYNPFTLLPVVKSINSLSSDFIEAFKISKKENDLTVFIEALLYILSMEMLDLENLVLKIYENKVEKKGKLSIELNSRQIKILEHLQINKKVTRKEYTKLMDISFMTAYRDIQELVEKEYLEQKGVGRGTFYVLKKQNKKNEDNNIPTFVDLSLKSDDN